MMIRYSAAALMGEQRSKRARVRKDEASQELFFACLSFVLLLVAALADVTLRL
ncbi:MAG: hypothetical protein AAB250_03370 [Bdellovibrionota bacterium]